MNTAEQIKLQAEEYHAYILGRIKWLIPKERRNAITLGSICSFTGLKPRIVKELITELRVETPICSKETEGGGYWLAETNQDIEEFVNMIKRRRDGYNKTIEIMSQHRFDLMDYQSENSAD